MQKQAAQEFPFVHGPRVAADGELDAWLLARRDAAQRPCLVRLPVTVQLNSARSAVHRAVLGTDLANAEMAVELDDSALGISLADRASTAGTDETRCALWLEGRWQGTTPGERRFKVERVVRPVTQEEQGAPLYALVAVEENAPPELVSALERLGNAATSIQEKRRIARQIEAAGKDAIPLLIASLGDGRSYETRDLVNRMNLPHFQDPEPVLGTTTVGMRAESLLYAIITPAATSPSTGNFKVYSEQILAITDWQSFWRAHRGQSLDAIHAMLAPLVDRYWAEHGTTQRVP